MPLTTAQVIFRYPIVGRIIFRQPKDEPEMDTTVLVENLVHADGTSLNNSAEHRYDSLILTLQILDSMIFIKYWIKICINLDG